MTTPEEKYKEKLGEMQARVKNLQSWLGSLIESQFRTSQDLDDTIEKITKLLTNRLLEIKQTKIIYQDLALIKERIAATLQE